MRQQAKRTYDSVKANFDILGLVTNNIENDDNHLFLGVLASQLGSGCYSLFKEAALQEGNKLSRQNLCALLTFLQDDECEALLMNNAYEFEKMPTSEWLHKLTTLKEQPGFDCCRAEAIHDALMEVELVDLPHYEMLLNLFREAHINLSDCQASVAKHCASASMNTKRSLWRVGAGLGKSHLMSFLAMLLLDAKPDSTIYLVYSTLDLMEKDSEMINAVKHLRKAEKRIKTLVAKTKKTLKPTDIVLIDECDEVYFSNLAWFDTTFKDASVIGFTATIPVQEDRTEKTLLKKFFGEHIFDSKLKLKSRSGEPELSSATTSTINEGAMLALINARKCPVLIYCDETRTNFLA